jgi:endopeptidase Clp ATP-binding regulatory subunit ClpX
LNFSKVAGGQLTFPQAVLGLPPYIRPQGFFIEDAMIDKKFPSPEDIQKEFEDFVKNRFGGTVQVFSHAASANEEKKATEEEPKTSKVKGLTFNYKPRQIKQHLDRYVIGQDEAKKALSIAVCDHYNQVFKTRDASIDQSDYAKQNVLILGPTGVGKTYLVKHIAKLIGVPFVKADATRFSETGYVGANVDDLIRDLVSQADGDISLAQYGIVYLDEADKLASSSDFRGKDVTGRGVQSGLLKLMEETEVDLSSGNDMRSQMQAFMEFQQKGSMSSKVINTKHILFIVSGAFSGLEESINKRLNQSGIGFSASQERLDREDDVLNEVTTQDLVDYGFEPEFVGRLPVRVACHHLSTEHLFSILKNSEGSIIRQYKDAFGAYNIDASFTDEALRAISEHAYSQKTGARSLMTVCENALREYKYELPSTQISQLVIDRSHIENPRSELQKILSDKSLVSDQKIRGAIRDFEADFAKEFGMKIRFNPTAEAALVSIFEKDDTDIKEYCGKLLQSYEHGLKLIQQNTGQDTFTFAEDVVHDPRGTLERLIRDSYGYTGKD